MTAASAGGCSFSNCKAIDQDKLLYMLSNNIGDLPYAPLINEVRGKQVLLHRPYGNVGDALLMESTRQMFRRYQVEFVECEPANYHAVLCGHPDVNLMVYGPGGNVSGRYKTGPVVTGLGALARDRKIRFICFPQSVEHWSPHLLEFDKIYLRDEASIRIAALARVEPHLVPDIGLNYRVDFPIPDAVHEEGCFPRQDAEKLQSRPVYNDPAVGVRSVQEYLRKAADYKQITTDRLHFAIAGILAGRDVTLVGNDYHKNESIWQSYLHLFCRFSKHFPKP